MVIDVPVSVGREFCHRSLVFERRTSNPRTTSNHGGKHLKKTGHSGPYFTSGVGASAFSPLLTIYTSLHPLASEGVRTMDAQDRLRVLVTAEYRL